jgi:hypothetical protein
VHALAPILPLLWYHTPTLNPNALNHRQQRLRPAGAAGSDGSLPLPAHPLAVGHGHRGGGLRRPSQRCRLPHGGGLPLGPGRLRPAGAGGRLEPERAHLLAGAPHGPPQHHPAALRPPSPLPRSQTRQEGPRRTRLLQEAYAVKARSSRLAERLGGGSSGLWWKGVWWLKGGD